ncbi:MAG: hypothetical protein IPH18_15025 [Chitinophagaceae bacterium]|nr:hypothetical protein [Chitinophagaceae bacterium]
MKLLLPVAFCFLGTSCIREQRSGVPQSGPPLMEKPRIPLPQLVPFLHQKVSGGKLLLHLADGCGNCR